MANDRTRLQEVQEELRFARQIRDNTDRDDADDLVKYWENELEIAKKEEQN